MGVALGAKGGWGCLPLGEYDLGNFSEKIRVSEKKTKRNPGGESRVLASVDVFI